MTSIKLVGPLCAVREDEMVDTDLGVPGVGGSYRRQISISFEAVVVRLKGSANTPRVQSRP
jgi:hypothetical protein